MTAQIISREPLTQFAMTLHTQLRSITSDLKRYKPDSRRINPLNVPLLLSFFAIIFSAQTHLSHAESSPMLNHETLVKHIWASPYTQLPQYQVTSKRFGSKKPNTNNHLYQAAKRTLNNQANWLINANTPKLFNANGICFKGRWIIDQPSPYTGGFSEGTNIPIIARASVALSGTKQKNKRAFGLALMLFDTHNHNYANIFTMHSLAGVKTPYVLDLPLTNEPALTGLPALSQIRTLLRINKDLKRADKSTGASMPKVNYRSLNTVAALAVEKLNTKDMASDKAPYEIISPTWIKFTPKTQERINKKDFREELNTNNYRNKKIEYDIFTAVGKVGKIKQAKWKKLGNIILTGSVVSLGCDINLHFSHPNLE